MSNQKLALLAVIAVGMVMWAISLSRQPDADKSGLNAPTYLLQGLDLKDVTGIEIGTGEDKVLLRRQGATYVVTNKGNYPVDVKQVNDLLTNCLDIQTSELYSSNAENHDMLECTEEKAKNVIKFLKGESELLTGIIVGKSKEEGQGTYVRLVASDDVYVTQKAPWFRTQATDYIDQELVAEKEEDVQLVQVKTGEDTYTLKRAEGGAFELENLPAGKKLRDNESQSVANALSSLRFDDVQMGPVKDLAFTDAFICQLKSGVVYKLALAKDDDKTYATCNAEYKGKKATIDPTKVDSEEELKAKEAILKAQEKAVKFQERHKGWVYEIPSWKSEALGKPLYDLLEDLPKPDSPVDVNVPTVLDGIDAAAPAVGPAVVPDANAIDQ
jgi:hypothetical protein